MLLIGLISVLPMVGYDIILNRMLEQKQNPRYLFETSWLINTINNIAGFGGFVSVGLRSELYGQKKEQKRDPSIIESFLVFDGWTFYLQSAFFLLVVFTPVAPFEAILDMVDRRRSIFSCRLLFTTFKRKDSGGTSLKTQGQLLLVSLLEWTGVLFSFLSVGYLMEIRIDLWQTIPLFIAASVIGIVSMIPGGVSM